MCIARTETFWVGLWSRSTGTMPLLAEAGPLLYNPFCHARIRWSQEEMQQVGYYRLSDEVELFDRRNDPGLVASMQQFTDRLAADVAVGERPLIDVHADEPVGQVLAHIPSVL